MPGCALPSRTTAKTSGDTPLFIVTVAAAATAVTFFLPFGMTFLRLTLTVAFGSTFAATFDVLFAVTVDAAPSGAAAADAMTAIATTAWRRQWIGPKGKGLRQGAIREADYVCT